jgi:hypothetical protein
MMGSFETMMVSNGTGKVSIETRLPSAVSAHFPGAAGLFSNAFYGPCGDLLQ